MKLLSTFATLLALGVLGAAEVDDHGKLGSERIECQTSSESPYMHHISQMVENLRGETHDNTCFSDMLGKKSERCGNTIKDYTGKNGGAVFSLCSGDMKLWDDLVERSSYVSGLRRLSL